MPLEIGTASPPVTLPAHAGDVTRAGKPTVLFFFKSTCPTCALAYPYVDALDRAFSDAAVNVWGVSQERQSIADEFGGRCGVSVPTVDDSALDTSRALDVQNVPTMYLLDAEGGVQDVVIGFDKAGLNRVAGTLADWTGSVAPVVAPADDGNPPAQPG